jgi:hypothetical protein
MISTSRARRRRVLAVFAALAASLVVAGLMLDSSFGESLRGAAERGVALRAAIEPPADSPKKDDSQPSLAFPVRPKDATAGNRLLSEVAARDIAAAEKRLVAEILAGNVPTVLRRLVPVVVRSRHAPPVTVWVTPDYLSVGSDDDSFRVPLTAPSAQRIANELGAILPTKTIVDAIHRAAGVKLLPRSAEKVPKMNWVDQVRHHERQIDAELASRRPKPGTLIAGHMKDVVISPALKHRPDKVAIYGLHWPNGEAIQPLSFFHELSYVDYSQGVRLLADVVEIEGRRQKLSAMLQDRTLAGIVSPGGSMRLPVYPSR